MLCCKFSTQWILALPNYCLLLESIIGILFSFYLEAETLLFGIGKRIASQMKQYNKQHVCNIIVICHRYFCLIKATVRKFAKGMSLL